MAGCLLFQSQQLLAAPAAPKEADKKIKIIDKKKFDESITDDKDMDSIGRKENNFINTYKPEIGILSGPVMPVGDLYKIFNVEFIDFMLFFVFFV